MLCMVMKFFLAILFLFVFSSANADFYFWIRPSLDVEQASELLKPGATLTCEKTKYNYGLAHQKLYKATGVGKNHECRKNQGNGYWFTECKNFSDPSDGEPIIYYHTKDKETCERLEIQIIKSLVANQKKSV